MLLCFTNTAIIILEHNMRGIIRVFFGLEQWAMFLHYYIAIFEKSLVNHKQQINAYGYTLAEKLKLPLMKDIGILRDMCREGRTPATLSKLRIYGNHLQHLISKPSAEWTEDLMKVHIYSIIDTEFNKIKEKVNDPKLASELGSTKSQPVVLDLSQPKGSQNSALDLSRPKSQ